MPDVTADDIGDGAAWTALTDRIAALRDIVWRDPELDADTRARGVEYLLRFLAAGIGVCIEHDDTRTPELGHMIHHRMTWGLDNPDCVYSYSRIDGAGTYRIAGDIGSARHLELQVNTGHQSDGDFAGWRAVSALGRDDIVVSPDGTFEVVISPARHDGNWMPIDDSASFLLVRQYFCDWDREHPARLVIERLDGQRPPPPTTADDVALRLGLLCDWLDIGARCWDGISRGILGSDPADITPFLPPAEASGLKGQAYGMGSWRCAPGDAVILELVAPRCRMWGVSLCDRWWQSIDHAERQSSLNSCQALPDPDGVVRFVIAHDDPGIANWLDPGGNTAGTLAVRYLAPDSLPPLTLRMIDRADVETALPDAARVSPAERADLLQRRHHAVVRRAWC